MESKLTAVFRKFPEGYAAFVEELPGANTQGKTLEEARENLKEAVAMVLQANRELAEESLRGADVVREPLAILGKRVLHKNSRVEGDRVKLRHAVWDHARERPDDRLVQRSRRKYSFGARSDDVTNVT